MKTKQITFYELEKYMIIVNTFFPDASWEYAKVINSNTIDPKTFKNSVHVRFLDTHKNYYLPFELFKDKEITIKLE